MLRRLCCRWRRVRGLSRGRTDRRRRRIGRSNRRRRTDRRRQRIGGSDRRGRSRSVGRRDRGSRSYRRRRPNPGDRLAREDERRAVSGASFGHFAGGNESVSDRIENFRAGKRLVVGIPSACEQHGTGRQERGRMSRTSFDHLGPHDELVRFRIVKLRRFVGASARYQYPSIAEQRCRMSGAALSHLRYLADSSSRWVEDFAGVDRAAPRVRTASSDQNAAITEQRCRVIDAIVIEFAGELKLSADRVVNLDLLVAAARDQHAAVAQQSRSLAVAARGHRAGFGKLIRRRVVKLGGRRRAPPNSYLIVLQSGGGRIVAGILHVRGGNELAVARVENLGRPQNPRHRRTRKHVQRDEQSIDAAHNQNLVDADGGRGELVARIVHRGDRQKLVECGIVNLGGVQNFRTLSGRPLDVTGAARNQDNRNQRPGSYTRRSRFGSGTPRSRRFLREPRRGTDAESNRVYEDSEAPRKE